MHSQLLPIIGRYRVCLIKSRDQKSTWQVDFDQLTYWSHVTIIVRNNTQRHFSM